MGNLIGRLRQKDDDYEHILASLDSSIHKAEIRISEANLSQRRVTGLATTYMAVVYTFWLFSFFFIDWPSVNWAKNPVESLQKVAPVFLAPLAIYLTRWMIFQYYRRYIQHQEQELDALRKQQKQKVEEMKQKMKYYMAKNLIDRYENQGKKPQQPATPVKQQQASVSQQLSTLQQPHTGLKPASHQHQLQPRDQSAPALSTFPLPNPPNAVHRQQVQQNSNILGPPGQEQYVRSWVDRVLDMIVGEEAPNQKYALICEKCFAHNGLTTPEEIGHIQYTCPKCGHFNAKRRRFTQASLPSIPNSPVVEPARTPESLQTSTTSPIKEEIPGSPLSGSEPVQEPLADQVLDDATPEDKESSSTGAETSKTRVRQRAKGSKGDDGP